MTDRTIRLRERDADELAGWEKLPAVALAIVVWAVVAFISESK